MRKRVMVFEIVIVNDVKKAVGHTDYSGKMDEK
jgi:hypothetical protein